MNLDAIPHVLNPHLQGAIALGSIEQSIVTEFASRTRQPPGYSLSDEVMASIPHDETNILLLRELQPGDELLGLGGIDGVNGGGAEGAIAGLFPSPDIDQGAGVVGGIDISHGLLRLKPRIVPAAVHLGAFLLVVVGARVAGDGRGGVADQFP